jgi:hypothetical protein
LPGDHLLAIALDGLRLHTKRRLLAHGGHSQLSLDAIVNSASDFPYVNTHHDLAAAIPGAQLVTIPKRDHLGAV